MTTRRELWWFIGLCAALALYGSVNLASAVSHWGHELAWRPLAQHLLWITLGTLLGWGAARFDAAALERFALRWHLVALAGIALVLVAGRAVGGNRNWLGVGGFGVQPSEFAKLTTILVLARFCGEHVVAGGYRWRDLSQPLWLLCAPALGVLLQGDMGTLLLLCALGGTIVLVARVRWTIWALVLACGLTVSTAAYYTILTPAQRSRITTFVDPASDPRGRGYHVLQARIAIGSGGLWGRGFLQGGMNKLRYLPEQHTDFIFPVLAEEWGFVGSSVVIAGLAALLMMLLMIAQTAASRFDAFLVIGVAASIFWQCTINLGGVLGLLPLTGVTLPFFSYGGSSTLTTYVMLGLVCGVAGRRKLFAK